MKRIFAFIMISAVICCCDNIQPTGVQPQIVVEGWIESNRFPVVMVTTTVPVTETITNLTELEEHVINWAKVSVSDGEQDVVLIGQKNDDYFPPYIYTTSAMRGKAGKTYTIKVEYSDRTVTASTTIPEPKQLEYLKVFKADNNDTLFYLAGGLNDDPLTKDYYKVFTQVRGTDSTYTSSFMGLFDDAIMSEDIHEIPINSGSGRFDKMTSAYFSANDTINIRFCTLDKESWMYWNDYEELLSLSTNPFFPINTVIHSNVDGGLGYWAGYGSSYYKVSIPDSLALGRIY